MCLHVCCCVWLFATPWTAARQAPLSMEFSRQEHWGGLPFPTPGDLPGPGIEPTTPALAGGFFTTVPPGRPQENPWRALKGHRASLLFSNQLFTSLLCSSWVCHLEEAGEKWILLAASHAAGEAGNKLTHIFPSRRNHQLRRSLLALSCATLGEG